MRLRGLIPVLLLLAACERSAPAPEATGGGRLTISEQQRRLNKSAAAWLNSFEEGGAEEILFDFWSRFDDLTSLARNPIFPVVFNLPPCLEGAYGYWAGYGATEYSVTIQ